MNIKKQDIKMERKKHLIKMKAYISTESLQFLNDLIPDESDQEVQSFIEMNSIVEITDLLTKMSRHDEGVDIQSLEIFQVYKEGKVFKYLVFIS